MILRLIMALCLASAAQADEARMITSAEQPAWNAVGRLNVAGNRSCTATLISDTEVITAAHCLFNPRTGHQAAPDTIRFVAGFRQGEYAALVRVDAVALLPAYAYTGLTADLTTISSDIALLHLSRPVLRSEAVPLAVLDLVAAGPVDVVGYGRDRPQIISIRANCPVLDKVQGAWLLDCPVLPGLSGAPAVMAGGQGLVAVVSSSVGTRVAGVQALLVPIASHLAALRARLK
jgi:protease YdgD